MATIAVITPTIGRPHLHACIERAFSLLRPGDCQFVIFDGLAKSPTVVREDLPVLPTLRCAEVSSVRSLSGNAQRDYGISLAAELAPSFDYLVFCDDDDLLCAEGVSVLHALQPRTPDAPLRLFAVSGGEILISPKADVKIDMKGSICGSCIVPPCVPGLPRWMDINIAAADPFFFGACKKLFPKIEAHPEVIVEVKGWRNTTNIKSWRKA